MPKLGNWVTDGGKATLVRDKEITVILWRSRSHIIVLHQALSCRHSLVALEVTLSLQRLVKKYGHELHVVAWDAVLDIIEALQKQIEV